jgi:tetratricopeptide (TPR) repeat protein
LRAEIQLISARAVYESSNDSEIERSLDSAERARDALERLNHEAGLAEAWVTIEYLEWMRGRTDRMHEAAREGFRRGVSSGRARDAMQAGGDMMWAAVAGSMSFGQIRAVGESLSGARDPISRAVSMNALAVADLAESSDAFDERERERASVIEQHGLDWLGAVQGLSIAYLEYQLGLPERMERRLLDARNVLEASNDVWWLNSATPLLGLAVWGQGRTREFLRIADAYDADIQVFDRDARVRRYLLRALASLARGALPEAERAGRTALELVEPTDLATTKADVLSALAEIAEARGFPEQAIAQRDRVTEIHRSRGNVAALAASRQARFVRRSTA